MESRQLRYFLALSEDAHFGRAAQKLHVSSPALSQAIKHLEDEIGTPLFERTTRQVALTPAGRWLRSEAEQILDRLDAATVAVSNFSRGTSGLLRIGLKGTNVFAYLPRIVHRLRQAMPDVELDVHADLLTPDQVDGLSTGTLDICFMRPPLEAGLLGTPFVSAPLLVALPNAHPLAGRATIGIEALRRESWIAYTNKRSVVNRTAMRLCHDAGFVPKIVHRCASTSILLAFVAAGMGVAIVQGGARAFGVEGVVFRELVGAEPLAIVMASKAGNTDPMIAKALSTLSSRPRS